MMMTFVLHPLSHYNSITKSRARFLLSLLEDLFIDYHANTLPFFHLLPKSPHFFMIGAIDAATVKRSVAQLRPRQPQTQTAASPTSTAPSTSAPSSFMGGVTLEAIMA